MHVVILLHVRELVGQEVCSAIVWRPDPPLIQVHAQSCRSRSPGSAHGGRHDHQLVRRQRPVNAGAGCCLPGDRVPANFYGPREGHRLTRSTKAMAGSRWARFQIEAWAKNYSDAVALAAAIRGVVRALISSARRRSMILQELDGTRNPRGFALAVPAVDRRQDLGFGSPRKDHKLNTLFVDEEHRPEAASAARRPEGEGEKFTLGSWCQLGSVPVQPPRLRLRHVNSRHLGPCIITRKHELPSAQEQISASSQGTRP